MDKKTKSIRVTLSNKELELMDFLLAEEGRISRSRVLGEAVRFYHEKKYPLYLQPKKRQGNDNQNDNQNDNVLENMSERQLKKQIKRVSDSLSGPDKCQIIGGDWDEKDKVCMTLAPNGHAIGLGPENLDKRFAENLANDLEKMAEALSLEKDSEGNPNSST